MFFGMRCRRTERERWPPGDSCVRPLLVLQSVELLLTINGEGLELAVLLHLHPLLPVLHDPATEAGSLSTPTGLFGGGGGHTSEGQIPFCGDFSAVDELGGGGHGSEVARRSCSHSSAAAAEGRGEGGDSSAHLWKGAKTCRGAAVRGRHGSSPFRVGGGGTLYLP